MSSYSVKKPITVLMGILIIIVLGAFSVTRLPLTLFPDINLPFVVTVTTYEGASPEEVETAVAKQIESAVATIGNFEEVQSISNQHFGVSIITFAQSTNMDTVVIELRELLNNIIFEEGVGSTRILRISPDMLPVMTVTLSRIYEEDLTDEEELIRNTEWIQQEVLLELQSIPGVADVTISGQADIVLEIDLDNDQLTLYGLDHQTVLETIENQNVGGLIGIALDSGELRMLYLGNQIINDEELANLPITLFGGEVIFLSDLIIEDGIKYINADNESYSKINGVQGIQVSFQKQSDIGITDVTENILNKLDEIVISDDLDASYTVLLDQGEYINLAIGTVLQNIIFGGILAILILFLFLRDIKPTLIVGLAIPISVVAAFLLMYLTNVSLNLVSMGGLALGIGMLVDNSIVVIENIYRMIGEGKSKQEASIHGAKQIAGAITASTLTTIAVFLPIAFIEGFVAEIFISMALTIAYSLGASLLIALTLVPAMGSRMLSDKNNKPEGKVIHKLKSAYKKSVLFTLKHKILTIAIILLLLVVSFGLVIAKGFVFLPESDEGSISLNVEVTTQTPFALRAAFADELTEILLDYNDIETVSGSINSSAMFGPRAMMGGGSSNTIEFTINLKEDRSKSTLYYEDLVRELIAEFDFTLVPGMTAENVVEATISAQNSAGALGGAQGVNIKVGGYDLLTIESIANDLVDVLSDIEGLEKMDNGITQGADNVKITVNKENAMLKGLTTQDVSDNISILYNSLGNFGQTQNLTLTLEGVTYTLDLPNEQIGGNISFDDFGDYNQFLSGIMLFDEETRLMIQNYYETTGQGIYIPNGLEAPIVLIVHPFLKVNGNNEIEFNPFSADPTLASLAVSMLTDNTAESVTTIERVTGFATINTDGTNRYVNVTAQVKEGYNVTLVGQDVTRAVNNYIESDAFAQYGGGYRITLAGENEDILQAVTDLALAAIVAILLVYMVMAIQFQSLVYPLIILGTIPLAFTGGMFALFITNSYLSLVSIMGMIILIGVVVNNGIVLIDYINVLRSEGKKIKDAIVEAGQTRLRPILMTALTTTLALSTLAIGVGQGAELLQPMAITAIGGLIYATILTLVFVPVIYALINRKKMKAEESIDVNN